ncbi:SGNH/GDSL hydrolase family protein [Spirillospora sp. NPDC048911]|uniref:SGNH/GDSL hydrolase family protein n=1 Tax=Spirillospora sp. NPDC048911 TaxID=3364527 RepID=UPI00371E619D
MRRLVISAIAVLLVLGACAGSAVRSRSPWRPADAVRAAHRPPVVFVLGDSYTTGIRGLRPEQTYAAEAARRLGWQVILAGRAGTGFVGTGMSGRTFGTLFDEQLAWRPAPDLVLVSGGHNDVWYPPGLVELNARLLLGKMKRRWPRTRVVLMGPLWGGDPKPAALVVRDVLREVAGELAIPFVDPLRGRWITGSVRTRKGNARRYIRADGTHPNVVGNRYIAARLVADLRRLPGVLPGR